MADEWIWNRWVEAAAEAAPQRAQKCLRRECIEGLQQAFLTAEVITADAEAGVGSVGGGGGVAAPSSGVATLDAPFTSAQVAAVTTAAVAGEPAQCPHPHPNPNPNPNPHPNPNPNPNPNANPNPNPNPNP
jgi:hypothetical protein